MFTSLTLFRILFFFWDYISCGQFRSLDYLWMNPGICFLCHAQFQSQLSLYFFCLLSDNRIFFYFARLFVVYLLICGIIVFSMNNFFSLWSTFSSVGLPIHWNVFISVALLLPCSFRLLLELSLPLFKFFFPFPITPKSLNCLGVKLISSCLTFLKLIEIYLEPFFCFV